MKSKKEFYQVTYMIKCRARGCRDVQRIGDYRYVSLKRLNEEIEWLKDLYKGKEKQWKLSFGPIFRCVEI